MNKKIYICILLFLNFLEIKTGTVNIIDESSSKEKYNNELYLNSYKIPYSMLIFISNGKWEGFHTLKNAFDGNFDSYWKSLRPQEKSFKNAIEITFSKTVSIDRILYQAPSLNNINGIGYPTELKVYYKLKKADNSYSQNDTDYLLIDDIISERTGEKVVFILDQVIECVQIKLEWTQIEQADDSASSDSLNAYASQIMPLFPENEYLNKLLFEVFDENDYCKMSLNKKYNDLLIIQEIEENIQDYLRTYKYIKLLIERAKKIIDEEIKFEKKREFTTNPKADINKINQFGDISNYSKQELKMSRGGIDRQPTGIYAFSGSKVTIFVEANNNDPLPRVIFTQYVGLYNDWRGYEYPLRKGINYFNVDRFNTSVRDNIKAGGPIYIVNPYTSEEQSQNIKIYIDGGLLFPVFRINDNEEDFKSILTDYINEFYQDVLNYFDIAEFYSDKIIITLNATYAYEMYFYQKESPQNNLLSWDKILKDFYTFDGIQFESNQPYYNNKNEYIKIHIRYSTNYEENTETYTYDKHIGILTKNQFKNCLASNKGIGRPLAHEIGNIIDVYSRSNEEKTNYMLEEYAIQVLFKNLSNTTNMEILYNEIAPDNIDNLLRNCGEKENCKGFYINSGNNKYSHYTWWAIESFYPGYWGKLNNLYRYNSNLIGGMTKNEAMVYFTSLIVGYNMEYYFERFGLAMTNETIFNKSDTTKSYKSQLEKAINETKIKTGIYKKLWYADNEQYNYIINNGTGCYKNKNDYEIKIKDISKKEGETTLTFAEIDCQGHLGFEIIENDVVIGFTSKNTFVDKNEYPSDYKPKYRIIAYDRLLDTKESKDS